MVFARCLVICWLSVLGLGSFANAEDPAPPKIHTVAAGPFEVAATLDGNIQSHGSVEIQIKPEEWSTFIVETAIESGELVEAGEELVKFETKAFDREFDDLQFQVDAGDLAIKLAQIELELLGKTNPLDLEAAERSAQVAAEEWDYFQKQGEALERQSVDENLKTIRDMLEGSEEELNQLEKMYKADDLTEETEEIILKRARRDVERAQFSLKLSQVHHDRRLEQELPREKRLKEVASDREALGLAKARVNLPLTLTQKSVELEKLQHAQKQLTQKFERLKKDKALLTLTAPINGVVVYGQAEHGKWTTTDAMRANLRRGGSISPHQVLMTIIPDAGANIWVDIPEKDIGNCRVGQTGEFTPTAYPHVLLPCELKGFTRVFAKEGIFGGVVDVKAAKDDPRQRTVMTGMTGKVRLVQFLEKNVIAVPSTAVFADEENANLRNVYVSVEGAEPRKQTVEVGLSSASRTHIKSGLQAGDKILLAKPEAK